VGRAGVRAAREGDDAGWGFLMHRSILILLVAVQALALASWVAVCAHRVYAEAAEMRTESRTAIRESDRILVAVLAALRRADPCAQSCMVRTAEADRAVLEYELSRWNDGAQGTE